VRFQKVVRHLAKAPLYINSCDLQDKPLSRTDPHSPLDAPQERLALGLSHGTFICIHIHTRSVRQGVIAYLRREGKCCLRNQQTCFRTCLFVPAAHETLAQRISRDRRQGSFCVPGCNGPCALARRRTRRNSSCRLRSSSVVQWDPASGGGTAHPSQCS
jgi:hypothetical protein